MPSFDIFAIIFFINAVPNFKFRLRLFEKWDQYVVDVILIPRSLLFNKRSNPLFSFLPRFT